MPGSLLPDYDMTSTDSWTQIAHEAQAYREASLSLLDPALPPLPNPLPLNVTGIPAQVLTPSELELTSHGPEVLVGLIASGQYTSEQVTRAYLRRAALAQRLVSTCESLNVMFRGWILL